MWINCLSIQTKDEGTSRPCRIPFLGIQKNTFLPLVQKVGVRFAVFVSGRRVHVGVLGQMFGEARELFQTGLVSFVAKERCSFLEQPMGKGRWSVDALNAYGSIVSVSVTPLPAR